VWTSKDAWLTYRDGHVQPAVQSLLAEVGIAEVPPPAEEELAVVDVVIGSAVARRP
jgi:hypothetical protein